MLWFFFDPFRFQVVPCCSILFKWFRFSPNHQISSCFGQHFRPKNQIEFLFASLKSWLQAGSFAYKKTYVRWNTVVFKVPTPKLNFSSSIYPYYYVKRMRKTLRIIYIMINAVLTNVNQWEGQKSVRLAHRAGCSLTRARIHLNSFTNNVYFKLPELVHLELCRVYKWKLWYFYLGCNKCSLGFHFQRHHLLYARYNLYRCGIHI